MGMYLRLPCHVYLHDVSQTVYIPPLPTSKSSHTILPLRLCLLNLLDPLQSLNNRPCTLFWYQTLCRRIRLHDLTLNLPYPELRFEDAHHAE